MKRHTIYFNLSILLRHEGSGEQAGWVAQCLEYDIAAQGKTIPDAKKAFAKTFLGQALVDAEHKKKPFQGIQQAPKMYWEAFDQADQLNDVRQSVDLSDNTPAFKDICRLTLRISPK